MGKALRRDVEAGRGWWRSVALHAVAGALLLAGAASVGAAAQQAPLRLDSGRVTVVAYPRDARLARSVLDSAVANDSFPGLPRSRQRILIAIAPDDRRFRDWIGTGAPEWGAAVAIPSEHRIVMQGSRAGSDAGNPMQVLRHELAHLALHEYLGDLPPRWFDEGYASFSAGEWGRDEVLTTSIALLAHGIPPLDSLDEGFYFDATRAQAAYALSYRAVASLASLDRERGLALFLRYWKEDGSMEQAIRRAYGITGAGFEERWRKETARRYGALALAANMSVALGLIGLIVVPLYVMRLRGKKRRLAAMLAADEARERAERESALRAIMELGRDSSDGRA
ncbi:MAG TPA: hypothetical protein VFT57_03685 [Gemmatimonadaceae bacterium]|nr:hypothetical protein [Gemmatimonadaceae bacterium]